MDDPRSNEQSRNLLDAAFRSPKRITITMPYKAYQRLQERSGQEGRSLSNLAAYLLDSTLSSQDCPPLAHENNSSEVMHDHKEWRSRRKV